MEGGCVSGVGAVDVGVQLDGSVWRTVVDMGVRHDGNGTVVCSFVIGWSLLCVWQACGLFIDRRLWCVCIFLSFLDCA